MKDLNYNVEDYLETIAGLRTNEKFNIDRSDVSFIGSIARQVFKGTGLTDRQHTAIKEKLLKYENELIKHEYLYLKENLEKFRMPLRSIDRSRWIKLVDNPDDIVYEASSNPWIAVRFSFQKNLISAIEELRKKLDEQPVYDKIKKIQYFEYNERNLYEIVNAFKNKNFEIDEQLLEAYEKILKFTEEDSIPGVYNYKIKNLHPNGKNLIVKELGPPNEDNILLYKDRSIKYGLKAVDNIVNDNSLECKIACRKNVSVLLDKDIYAIDTVLLSLEKLKRLPLLILVPSTTPYDSIVTIHNYIKNLISSSDVSVSFRMDNQNEGINFNQYIKREKINNKVDSNTKIVYNLDTKVPKPLINSNWTPGTILVAGTTSFNSTRKVLDMYPGVDLIIHYGEEKSPGYLRYMRREMDSI